MLKIWTLEPKKHKKKISVVFDEGFQRICYNELDDLVEIGKIFICFCKNQSCWEPEWLTLEQIFLQKKTSFSVVMKSSAKNIDGLQIWVNTIKLNEKKVSAKFFLPRTPRN